MGKPRSAAPTRAESAAARTGIGWPTHPPHPVPARAPFVRCLSRVCGRQWCVRSFSGNRLRGCLRPPPCTARLLPGELPGELPDKVVLPNYPENYPLRRELPWVVLRVVLSRPEPELKSKRSLAVYRGCKSDNRLAQRGGRCARRSHMLYTHTSSRDTAWTHRPTRSGARAARPTSLGVQRRARACASDRAVWSSRRRGGRDESGDRVEVEDAAMRRRTVLTSETRASSSSVAPLGGLTTSSCVRAANQGMSMQPAARAEEAEAAAA